MYKKDVVFSAIGAAAIERPCGRFSERFIFYAFVKRKFLETALLTKRSTNIETYRILTLNNIDINVCRVYSCRATPQNTSPRVSTHIAHMPLYISNARKVRPASYVSSIHTY